MFHVFFYWLFMCVCMHICVFTVGGNISEEMKNQILQNEVI